MRGTYPLAGGVAAGLLATAAYAGPVETLTFDSLVHGEIVTTQLAGVTISALNPNKPFDLAIIFDSRMTGTADPDLEGPPWSAGNLAPDTQLGNLLIIAENDVDGDGDGLIDDPDDEQARPAGSLIFSFAAPITSFGFDIIDVEDLTAEAGSIDFYTDGNLVLTVDFLELVDPLSDYYDPTLAFGDNSANRIQPFVVGGGAGYSSWDEVHINLGGSGAVDNINFTNIPAPAASALLALGLLGRSRRRRG